MSRCWKLGLKVRYYQWKKTTLPMVDNGLGVTDAGVQVLSEKLDVAFRQLRVSVLGGVGFVGKGFFLFCFFWGAEV